MQWLAPVAVAVVVVAVLLGLHVALGASRHATDFSKERDTPPRQTVALAAVARIASLASQAVLELRKR
jgi:hypothetical protein